MSEPLEGRQTVGEPAADATTSGASTVVASPSDTSGSAPSPGISDTHGTAADVDTTASESSRVGPSEAVLGPFTTRELVFGGGVLLMFIGTLLPFVGGRVLYTTFWSSASLFFVGVGMLLPVIALALLAGRRLGSSDLRVGSLSVDQFASVTAVLAATFFFLQTVTAFQIGPFVALLGSLALLAATVVGPYLPVVRNDFLERPESAAHPLARPITAAKPRPPKPAKTASPSKETAVGSPSGEALTGQAPGGDRGATGAGLFGLGRSTGAPTQADPVPGFVADSTGHDAGHGSSAVGSRDSRNTRGSGDALDDATASYRPIEDHDEPVEHHDVVGNQTDQALAVDGPDLGSGHDVDDARSVTDRTRVHEAIRDDTPPTEEATQGRARQEPITATRSAEEEDVVEAFWFAVGSPRPVFDEQNGREIFVLQPGDWEVGIEDRGREFLVQDKRTGAIGILRDLRNIERAPRD